MCLGGGGVKGQSSSCYPGIERTFHTFRLISICMLITNIKKDILETVTPLYLNANWQVLRQYFKTLKV